MESNSVSQKQWLLAFLTNQTYYVPTIWPAFVIKKAFVRLLLTR